MHVSRHEVGDLFVYVSVYRKGVASIELRIIFTQYRYMILGGGYVLFGK